MTISHSPADDGRKNSSESSCYAYIYCYFFTCLPSCINLSNINIVITQLMTVERIHPKAPVMLIFIAIFTCLPSCINLSNINIVTLVMVN